MFAEIVAIHNKNVGKTIHTDVFLSILFEKGFITKNRDGSYYVSSFKAYKVKLKNGGFMKYDPKTEFVEVLKKIPPKTKPKDL